MVLYETRSVEETRDLGKRLGRQSRPGQVYALEGGLGAGKTAFAQGFAQGLGIEDPINSPTFTILQVYENGSLPLYHFDVYRIEDPEEMEEIGYEEYFFSDGVCLIEWAGLIRDLLPADTIFLRLRQDPEKGFGYRAILVGREGKET